MSFLRSISFEAFAATADFADQGLINEDTTKVAFHATNGRYGGGCCQITDDDKALSVPVTPGGATPQTVFIGASCKVSAYPAAADHLIQFKDSNGTIAATLILQPSGIIKAYEGTISVKGETSAPVPLDEYFWLEVQFRPDSLTGICEIRFNETTVLNLTGANLDNASLKDVGTVNFKGAAGTTTSWDDILIMDDQGTTFNTHMGDLKIEKKAPTADTAQDDFTPSTATDNYAMVDDIPSDGDTSYNASNTVNDEDLLAHAALGATPVTVHGVVVNLIAKDTGVSRGLKASCKSNATTVRGAEKTLAGGYTHFQEMYAKDPDGDVAWDGAAVDAADYGYQVSS